MNGKERWTLWHVVAVIAGVMLRPGGAEGGANHALVVQGEGYVKATGIDLDQTSFSWELWVNASTMPAVGQMHWAFMHAGPCSYHQCLLFGFDEKPQAIFGFILNDMRTGSFGADAGMWVHWAGTYNRASSDRILYRNGEPVGEDKASNPYTPKSTDLFIGQDNIGNNRWRGTIDELRIWKGVVLSQPVVQQYMKLNTVKGHPHEDKLAVYFQFDEPGFSITDSSPHRIVGTLNGLHVTSAFTAGAPVAAPSDVAALQSGQEGAGQGSKGGSGTQRHKVAVSSPPSGTTATTGAALAALAFAAFVAVRLIRRRLRKTKF